MRTSLPPIADQVATKAVKGAVGAQVQKLIDAQVARATGPLLERIETLERRVAALEKGSQGSPGPQRPAAPTAQRSDDI